MESIPLELAELLTEAERLFHSDSAAEQAVVLRTAGSGLYHFANHNVTAGDTAEEESFVKALAGKQDTEVRYLVCLWRDRTPDVPSFHLRQRLEELNPLNGNAKVLLRGDGGFAVRELKTLV